MFSIIRKTQIVGPGDQNGKQMDFYILQLTSLILLVSDSFMNIKDSNYSQFDVGRFQLLELKHTNSLVSNSLQQIIALK